MIEKKELVERHRQEEAFHDSKYTKKQARPRHYDFDPTYKIFLCMKEMMGLPFGFYKYMNVAKGIEIH